MSSEESKTPGDRLRQLRKSKGITQPELAEKLAVSKSYVSQIERGERGPSAAFLMKLKEVFGISSDSILYGFEEEEKKPTVQAHELIYGEKLFNNVKEILESGNIDLVTALKANIKAFLGAARAAKEKRQYPRFLLNLPVDVQIMDELEARPGMAVNASQMGLLIQSAYDLPVGKKIDLKVAFQKTGGPESFRAKAEIMWKDKRRLEDTEQFHYGVKLIEVLNEGHAKLESLLRE